MKYIAVLFGIFFLYGCGEKNTIKECDNTFVISGTGRNIYLFEHEAGDIKFDLIRKYQHATDAFFDCKENSVVALQHSYTEKNIQEAVVVYSIKDNSKTEHRTKSGFNGLIARYDHGFIFSTTLLKNSLVDTKQNGYIPSRKIFPKSFVEEEKKKLDPQLVADYRNGKRWYAYTEDKFFDLKSKKITDTYPFGMRAIAERIDKILYVYAGDFIKIDLSTKKAEKLLDEADENRTYKSLRVPAKRVGLFVNGIYYIITSSKSWDTIFDRNDRRAVKFLKGAIYQIKDKRISFLTKLPFENIVYANSPDKKNLYLFTKDRKVFKYNISKNTTELIVDIDDYINLSSEYILRTVGFTNNNFILAFEHKNQYKTYIVLSDKHFSKFSRPYLVDESYINITTQKSVQTNTMRSNRI